MKLLLAHRRLSKSKPLCALVTIKSNSLPFHFKLVFSLCVLVGWNRNMNSNRRRALDLIPINEVSNHLDEKVSVMGVVLDFSFPRKSQGTDYVCVLKIVDQSQQSPALSVPIFTEKREELPVISSRTDIIVLRKVKIGKYNDDFTAKFDKKFSSFGLFDGTVGSGHGCLQVYGSFSLYRTELELIEDVSRWWSSVHLDWGNCEYLVPMKEIIEEGYFDLICKVFHVSFEAPKGQWMLFVWDGTDVPASSLKGRLKENEQNPLPLQIESVPLDQYIINRFPRIGTLLRILADEGHENLELHFQRVPYWMKIRNIKFRTSAGLWCGYLNSFSKVQFLANDDNVVEATTRSFTERVATLDRAPMWGDPCKLTAIDHDGERFVTLMDVITHDEDIIFRCTIRVVAINHVEGNFSSPHMMTLTVEDPTARLHAILRGTEMNKFFGGRALDDSILLLKRLLGVPGHISMDDDGVSRLPPLVKCCIASSKDDSGNRVYHICSTRLVS